MNTTTQALRHIARTTDTALAPLWDKARGLRYQMTTAAEAIKKYQHRGRTVEVADHQARLDKAEAELAEVNAEAAPLEDIAIAGAWARYIFVPGGHVHRFHCGTLRPTTTILWIPDYSGAREGELVEDAGEAACTVCFPTAPVNRPSTIALVVEDRKADEDRKAAERAEREAKKAKAAATAIRDADGTTAYKSQRAAENALGNHLGSAAYFATHHDEIQAWDGHALAWMTVANPETEEEARARKAFLVADELAEARGIADLLDANGHDASATWSKKVTKAGKEAAKHGGHIIANLDR